MAKKTKKPSEERTRKFSKRQLTVALVVSILVVALGSVAFLLFSKPSETSFPLTAAIIDQLSGELPNPEFVENITSVLENHNFTVIYQNKTVNVDYFRNLAKSNYGIIIFRVHVALRSDSTTVDFFTTERFNPNLHVQELESGLVVKGVLEYSAPPNEYFAVTADFIENLEGTFPKSIVVAMGCWSGKPDLEKPMADAFVKKGAKAYIGWTNLVGVAHSDTETMKLIKNIAENKTLGQAVASVKPDMDYPPNPSWMRCYPDTAEDMRVYDLIGSARDSINYELRLTASDCHARVKHREESKGASNLVDLLNT
jgi:hypothetical protein